MSNSRDLSPSVLIQNGKIDEFEKLLKEKAFDSNQKNSDGYTLLDQAVYFGKIEFVKLLLKNGADPNRADNQSNYTSLSFTAFIQDKEARKAIQKILEEDGAKYGAQYRAASHSDIIQILQKLGLGYPQIEEGVCHGLASVAIDYYLQGKKGIKKLNKILLALGAYDTQTIAEKIELAKAIQQRITVSEKNKIKERYQKNLFLQITKDKNLELIDKILKEKFFDSNAQERTQLTELIYKQMVGEKIACENTNRIFKQIKNKIKDAQIDFLVQQDLKKLIHQELIKNKINPLLLEANNYLESVVISHKTWKRYPFFSRRYYSYQHTALSSQVVNSHQAEKIGLAYLEESDFFSSYLEEELEYVFALWKEKLREHQIQAPVCFYLSCAGHAISIAYLPVTQKWVFSNYGGNVLLKTQETSVLSKAVYEALDINQSKTNTIPMSAKIYTSKQNEAGIKNVIQEMKHDTNWKKIHEIKKHNQSEIRILAANSNNTTQAKKFATLEFFWEALKKDFLQMEKFLVMQSFSTGVLLGFIGTLLFLMAFSGFTGLAIAGFVIGGIAASMLYAYSTFGRLHTETQIISTGSKIKQNMEKNLNLRAEKKANMIPRKQVDCTEVLNSKKDQEMKNENSLLKEFDKDDSPKETVSKKNISKKTDVLFTSNAAEKDIPLFTPQHEHYLHLQKEWKVIWKSHLKNYHDIKSASKAGFFDTFDKFKLQHVYYKNIFKLLHIKFHPENYESYIKEIKNNLLKISNLPKLSINPELDQFKNLIKNGPFSFENDGEYTESQSLASMK